MDEAELAAWLANKVSDSFGVNVEDGQCDGCTDFYVELQGKRFKVAITECGEDL